MVIGIVLVENVRKRKGDNNMEQITQLLSYIHGWLAGIALIDAIIAMCVIAVVVRVYRIDWK